VSVELTRSRTATYRKTTKKGRSLARTTKRPQNNDVVPVNALADALRKEIAARAMESGSALSAVTPQLVDELAEIQAKILLKILTQGLDGQEATRQVQSSSFTPKILYKDRKQHERLRRLSPQDFIAQTDWAAVRDAGVLTGTMILHLDKSLYSAFSNRASYYKTTVQKLMSEIGILTRDDLVNPTPSKRAMLANVATSLITSAKER
jgi:hypothetical protein